MYKLFHQLDRQEKAQKENAELLQFEALYNDTCRRDSFSTITTHDSAILVVKEPTALASVTWSGGDGRLPLEISFPGSHESLVVIDLQTQDRPDESNHLLDDGKGGVAKPVTLPTTLFVDDDEELDLIYRDGQESSVIQKESHMFSPPALICQSSSQSSSQSSIQSQSKLSDQSQSKVSSQCSSQYSSQCSSKCSCECSCAFTSGSSVVYIDEDPEDMCRFETERFTRFEI